MDGYSINKLPLGTSAVFRARRNTARERFSHASDLWCPPAELVQMGRFNRPGESVFYASSTINAALWEVRPKVGEVVTVAICTPVVAPAVFHLTHIGLHHYQGNPDAFWRGVPDIRSNPSFMGDLRQLGIDRKWSRIDDFLSELATRPVGEQAGLYEATSQLGETLLRVPNTDGIIYPSVAAGLAAFNIRLNRVAAEQILGIAEVWEFEVIRHFSELAGRPPSEPGYLLTKALRRSATIAAGGEINWLQDFPKGPEADMRSIISRASQIPPFLFT